MTNGFRKELVSNKDIGSKKVVMKLLQRFDQQVVDRKPHRPAPVGVAAEEPGIGLRRLVAHRQLRAIDPKRDACGLVGYISH